MSKKTMTIAFPRGGKIPGSVLGTEKERACKPHEPVKVPEGYGRHLLDERFAYEPKTQSKAEKAADDRAARQAEEARVAQEKAERRAGLEKAVQEAEARVQAASDIDAKAQAEADLETAKKALAAFDKA